MKTLFTVILALAVILSMTAFAQYPSKEPAQKDQAAQAPLKSVDGTVKVDGDKITLIADKDQKSWPSTILRHSRAMKATMYR